MSSASPAGIPTRNEYPSGLAQLNNLAQSAPELTDRLHALATTQAASLLKTLRGYLAGEPVEDVVRLVALAGAFRELVDQIGSLAEGLESCWADLGLRIPQPEPGSLDAAALEHVRQQMARGEVVDHGHAPRPSSPT